MADTTILAERQRATDAGRCQLYCAVDTGDMARARDLVAAVGRHVDGIKLGLEFYFAQGPDGARAIAEACGLPIFLDLKLHDIPNTVAGGMRSLRALAPHYVTIHAAGGRAMLRAACDMAAENAAATGKLATRVLGVTVLTSIDDRDLAETGIVCAASDQVRRLAALAADAGCPGIVASPLEIGLVRATCGPAVDIVTPGVRPHGSAVGDQKRLMTPREAADAGATAVVVGRPITAAPDPAAAARAIAASLATPPR
ncbi:MAG: orotidine-5'-phosphate decarboxylase [Alphaproteobacteria bacterium]